MERIKKISMLCVVLALVAPAMAADYFVRYDLNVSGAASLDTGYYDASPDATAAANFRTDYVDVVANGYDINVNPNPYYVFTGPAAAMPTASDTVRFQQLTTNEIRLLTGITAGTTYFGDTWFPLSNTAQTQGIRSDHGVRAVANYTTGDFNFGRSSAEDFDFAANNLTLPLVDVTGFFSVRDGAQFSADAVRMLSDTTHARTGWAPNPQRVNLTIGTNSTAARTQSVSIGDMYLSDSVLFLHASTGTWNITGDIQEQGELMMLLFGRENIGGPVYGAASGEGATLNIKWATLLDMIGNGQLYLTAYAGDKAWARQRIGAEFDYDGVRPGQLITLANMYDTLDIVSLGGGMVQVHAIPEPATMVLLGLGAVLSFRRKR